MSHTKAALFGKQLLRIGFVCSGVHTAFVPREGQILERRHNQYIFNLFLLCFGRLGGMIYVKRVFDPGEGSSVPLLA